jgi:hypothetical protein
MQSVPTWPWGPVARLWRVSQFARLPPRRVGIFSRLRLRRAALLLRLPGHEYTSWVSELGFSRHQGLLAFLPNLCHFLLQFLLHNLAPGCVHASVSIPFKGDRGEDCVKYINLRRAPLNLLVLDDNQDGYRVLGQRLGRDGLQLGFRHFTVVLGFRAHDGPIERGRNMSITLLGRIS